MHAFTPSELSAHWLVRCACFPILVLGLVSAAFGQAMRVSAPDAQPVTIESATVSAEITGRLAVTTFDLVFRNPNARPLEGAFEFPLLDGQSVVRFALDIDGKLRDGVPVEKTKARVVFEEIERRRVDPGLIEKTDGNNYRVRVFPLPAGGTRRVVIAYQEDLGLTDSGSAYRLALNFPAPLKTFRLSLTAHAGETVPVTTRNTLGLDLPAWQSQRALVIEKADFAAQGVLEIALPPAHRPRVIAGEHGGARYFYGEVPVDLTPRPRPAPRKVALLWDSSGSALTADAAKTFAFLDAWFSALGTVDVHLVRLRDRAEAPIVFPVSGGNWAELKRELLTTAYDGATSLDGLADLADVDEWLLVSDGVINYGTSGRPSRLPVRGVVHTVLTSARADAAWLRGIAGRHGGEFVDLITLSADDAAKRLRSETCRVLDVTTDAADVAHVFPEPGTLVAMSPLVVTGKLRGPSATLRLSIGYAAEDARVVAIPIPPEVPESALAPRAWAAAKIAALTIDLERNREDVRRTSRDFGIVTTDTSLLVLETVADYVTYDIRPPAELLGEWEARKQAQARARGKEREDHLTQVAAAFQKKVAWWEKKFPKDPPPPKAAQNGVARSVGGRPVRPAPDATVLGPGSDVSSPALMESDEGMVELSPFSVTAEATLRARADADRRGSERRMAAPPLMAARSAAGDGAAEPAPEGPAIALQPWSSDAGYLDRLRRTAPARRLAVYLDERTDHARQPGFYLDVAEFFFDEGEPALGLRVLSNLAELELEDVALLRVLALRLMQAQRADLALPLLERVLQLRPDEPQSRRDLALACRDVGQFQRAVDLLWQLVESPSSQRFPEIELIALGELHAIAEMCGQRVDLSRVDARLRRHLPVDLRVVLTWDANDCDIDLWVTDPHGEKAFYSQPLTYQGGRMSRDFTGGYGPEEFLLRSPVRGKYRVQINYFGQSSATPLGPVTAQVKLITGFGTAEQQEKTLTVRLTDQKQSLDIGTFEVGGKQ
ncbi:MAG TPA: VIT domain-containing protein [Opitutaceae bacterium]